MVASTVSAAAADRSFACWWSGNLYLLLRESTAAQGFSDEYATLIVQHGLPGLAPTQVHLASWVLVQLGQIETGLSQMLQHKTEVVERAGVFAPWLFVALASAYLAGGGIGRHSPDG